VADEQVTVTALLRDKFSGTADKLRTFFKGTATDVKDLASKVSPLTSAIAGLTASYASLAAAQRAITAASEQVQAEQALTFALRGRRDVLAQILKQAEDIQANTLVGDEKVLQIATLLANSGVEAGKLAGAIEATVDAATALSLPLEGAARAIAKLDEGEGLLLAQKVPELRDLAKAGTLAAEGIELLRAKFKGAAAELAKTDFGKDTQAINLFDDTLERVGKRLISVKLIFDRGLNSAAAEFADFLDSDVGRGLLKVLEAAVSQGLKLLPIISAVVAGVAAVGFAAWLAPIAVVAAKLTVVSAIVVGLVTAVIGLADGFEPIKKFLTEASAKVKGVVEDLGSGKLEVEDLVDIATTGLRRLFITIDAFVITPLSEFLPAIGDTVSAVIAIIIADILGGVGKVVKGIVDSALYVTHFIAFLADGVTAGLSEAIGALPGVSKEAAAAIRTNLANSVPSSLKGLDKFVDDLGLIGNEAAKALKTALPNAVYAVVQNVANAVIEIDGLDTDLQQRTLQRSKDRLKAQDDAQAAATDAELARRLALAKAIAALERQVDQVEQQQSEESAKRQGARDLARLKGQLDDELITFSEYFELRRELEVEPLEAKLAKQREAEAAVRDEIVAIRQVQGENADVIDQLGKLLDLRQKSLATEEDLKDAQAGLSQLLRERAEQIKQENARVRETAQALLDKVVEARKELQKARQETADLTTSGNITQAEAFRQNAEAVQNYSEALKQAQADLDQLIAKNPQLAASLQDIKDKLTGLEQSAPKQAGQTFADFADGFQVGARQTIEDFADMSKAGEKFGTVAVNAMSGLVSGLVKGGFKFKEFLGNFLLGIADMIAQLIVFNAVKNALGLGSLAISGATASAGTSAVLNQGGKAIRFSDGGSVPGPNVNADVISALLTPDEWVINRDASRYYGDVAMSAINNKLIPPGLLQGFGRSMPSSVPKSRFAEGGQVLQGAGSGNVVPGFVADDQTMDRLLAGGGNSMFRFLANNAPRLRTLLGVKGR